MSNVATETLNKIKSILKGESKQEFATMKLEPSGAMIEAEIFESGKEVFLVKDGERIALPIGEYPMEDGKVLVVVEEGLIDSIKDQEAPAEDTDMNQDKPTDTPAATQNKEPKKVAETITKEMFFEEMKKAREETKAEILQEFSAILAEALNPDAKKEEVKEDKQEFAKADDADAPEKPLKHNPEIKDENVQRLNFNSQEFKDMTYKERIAAALNGKK